MSKEEIFEYVQKQYGTLPEYLWRKSPDSAVLRHKNGKWYAVIMSVEKSKLGLDGDDIVDILDVKCDPEMTGMIIQTYGFLPGYHMNKKYWISVCFNADVPDKEIKALVKQSYDIVVTSLSKKEKEALRIM